jgi:OOP family OmpA-OmpF porin
MRLSVLAVIFVTFNYKAQNLVSNGGFEEYKKCPNDISQINRANKWKTPSDGTSDYYNECSFVSASKKTSGIIKAYQGKGYAGFGLFQSVYEIRYEFIQNVLISKLVAGNNYCLSFYLRKDQIAELNYKSISCLVSSKKAKITNWQFFNQALKAENIFLANANYNNNGKDWQKVCLYFTSKGNEKYLTIGFDEIKEREKPKKNNEMKELFSYFFIDEVTLVKIEDQKECNCIASEVEIIDSAKVTVVKSVYDSAKKSPFILKNVVFATNKSELLSSSFEELDNLASYLKKNDKIKIEISGYTDNEGNEGSNLKLSKGRAEAVAKYLSEKGISAKRIIHNGYGSKNPINPNNTKENKAYNRRVEFKLLEN